MTREILYANEKAGNYAPIKEFHALNTLPPHSKIEGRHKGRFESKKKAGVFYHIFETETGEAHAYGSCKVLDMRVNEFKEKVVELGLNEEEVMMSVTFFGRLPNKENSNSSYKFSQVEIFRPVADT